ncbi:MAG: phosphotransferase family protein [Vicinamibacteria bacterium]
MAKADELREQLISFCSSRLGTDIEIDELVRLSGGASRETWSFAMSDGTQTRKLVLRRDPLGAPPRGDRRDEVGLLERAARAGVPVPTVLWNSTEDALGSPGFIMDHVEGETIARRILRDEVYAAARPVMSRQCGEIAAKIHSIPTKDLDGMDPPDGSPAQAVLDQYSTLLESMGEPHPVFELAMRWLSKRMPPSDRITLVHGDFRNGNFIVSPGGIRAVLDWELAHLGDPWEDLAWVCMRSWRFGAPGEVGGFGERDDFYTAYEKTAGIPVDRDAVKWWEVMSNVKWGVMTIGQAFTHLWGHVRSLELAAIGRRTVETEYDVLRLIKEVG